MTYRLIDTKTNLPVEIGATLTDFRGETAVLRGATPPHKPSSTGRVYVQEGDCSAEYFPSVYKLQWVEE